MRRGSVIAGQTALVTGLGPIGVLTAAVCQAYGLTVIGTEVSALRRELALSSGAVDHVLDPTSCDVVAEVRRLTESKGADVGFECSSSPAALDELLDAVRVAATVVLVSVWTGDVPVKLLKVVLRELDLRGTIAYAHDHPATIALVEEGKVDLAPFISARIGFDDVVTEGFERLIHHNETAVKILVSPDL